MTSSLFEFDFQSCPDWMASYESFHMRQIHSSEAKYLVHHVIPGAGAGGLGDCLRAMMFTTRLSMASSRVVLFRWETPLVRSNPHTDFATHITFCEALMLLLEVLVNTCISIHIVLRYVIKVAII